MTKLLKSSDFKPPKPNRFFIGLLEFLFPLYLKYIDRLSFDFHEGFEHSLQFLHGKSVVVVINHSDRQDPLVVIALARYLREAVYTITAREVFDWNSGIRGWFFQMFGCFSVNRGAIDFKSIHTLQNILKQGREKLIVFPEAQITADEHSVHDLSPSLVHILLEAQDEMTKTEANRSIWILPVGVSYKLETELNESIEPALNLIERKLNICNGSKEPGLRVITAVEVVLQQLSQNYRAVLPGETPYHEQVRFLNRHICARIAAYIGSDHDPHASTEQLLYHLRNAVLEVVNSERAGSQYKQSLSRNSAAPGFRFLHDLDRVERLLIFERILSQPTSPIQICRLVDFLEQETCGRMTAKGRQRASIFSAQPIEILPRLQFYQTNKHAAVDELGNSIRSALQSALDNAHQALDSEIGELPGVRSR